MTAPNVWPARMKSYRVGALTSSSSVPSQRCQAMAPPHPKSVVLQTPIMPLPSAAYRSVWPLPPWPSRNRKKASVAKISGEMKVRSTKNSLTSSIRTLNQVTYPMRRRVRPALMASSSEGRGAIRAVGAARAGDEVHVGVLQGRLTSNDLSDACVAERAEETLRDLGPSLALDQQDLALVALLGVDRDHLRVAPQAIDRLRRHAEGLDLDDGPVEHGRLQVGEIAQVGEAADPIVEAAVAAEDVADAPPHLGGLAHDIETHYPCRAGGR